MQGIFLFKRQLRLSAVMIINRIFVRRYSENFFDVPIGSLSSSSNTNSHFNNFLYQLDLILKERVLFEEVNLCGKSACM